MEAQGSLKVMDAVLIKSQEDVLFSFFFPPRFLIEIWLTHNVVLISAV